MSALDYGFLAAGAVAVLAIAALVVQERRHRRRAARELQVPQEQRDQAGRDMARRLLRDSRTDGVRYEIRVTDWGPEFMVSEMRHRWMVLDADRALRAQVYQGEEDPDGQLGVELPYLLGNAPTREQAVAEALGYVLAQDATAFVLVATEEGS